jgi:hypothetical protein
MSTNEKNQSDSEFEHEGEALLIQGRVTKLEEEQKEARKRDEDYKKRQVDYSKKVAWFTGALVVTSLVTNAIYLDMSCTARKNASAAKSAAETARIALHISQRAYVSMPFPLLDSKKMTVTFTPNNSGQIPSGPAEIIVHEATADRTPKNSELSIVECHWHKYKLARIFRGSSLTSRDNPGLLMPLHRASITKIQANIESITVAGTMTYNDGFVEDGSDTQIFCFQTIYNPIEKEPMWMPCDADSIIKRLELLDGYPKNEDQNCANQKYG